MVSLCKHSKKAERVDTCQQDVISEHAKALAGISSPSVKCAASNPNRIHCKEWWVWDRDRHSKSASDTNAPSKKLNAKTKRMSSVVISDPIKSRFK